jgi:hypothetical protein
VRPAKSGAAAVSELAHVLQGEGILGARRERAASRSRMYKHQKYAQPSRTADAKPLVRRLLPLIGHELYWTNLINSILVVSGTAVVVLEVAPGRAASRSFTRSLLWPLLIFGIFVALENKRIQPGGINMEPVGFLVLLAGFVSIAVWRALTTERRLMDVEHELTTARRIQRRHTVRPKFSRV